MIRVAIGRAAAELCRGGAHTDMHVERTHLLYLVLAFAPACVVDDSDDDDASEETDGDSNGDSNGDSADSNGDSADDSNGDSADDSNGDSADDSNGDSADDSNGDDTATTSAGDDSSGGDSADDSSGDESPPGDAIPEEGPWLYSETGQTTNDCTFVAQPSNGWGAYLVEAASASGFTIAPGDGTDPFDCELASGAYHCPERLVDTITQPGFDISANVFVVIDGDILSSTEMNGSQIGHIECEGSDCAAAEAALGVTFPCDFEIPFTGSKS